MKKIVFTLLVIATSLFASAQEQLTLAKDSIVIGNYVGYSDQDGIIYIDKCSKINIVAFSAEFQNAKRSINIRTKKGVQVYSHLGLNNVTPALKDAKQFFVGNDSLDVFVSDTLRYTIVPTPKLVIPEGRTRLAVYMDSLRIERGDTVIATINNTDSVGILEELVTIDWISLDGIFNKKHHRICFIQGNDTINRVIVAGDSCNIQLGKNTTYISIDDSSKFCIAPHDIGSGDSSLKLKQRILSTLKWIQSVFARIPQCLWISVACIFIGIVGYVVSLVVRKRSRGPIVPAGSGEIEDKTPATFVSIWEKLTEEQRKEVFALMQDEYHLYNVLELSVAELEDLLTKEQKQRIVENNLSLKDKIQKLSTEKLIEYISNEQERGLSALYTKTETKYEYKSVDISKMDSAVLINAMTSEQLRGILTMYPKRKLSIPKELWSYIFEQLRNDNNKDALCALIAGVFRNNDGIDERIWDAVTYRILKGKANTNKISFAVTQMQLCKNDKETLDLVSDIVADAINKRDKSIDLPHRWDDLLDSLISSNNQNNEPIIVGNPISDALEELNNIKRELIDTQGELETKEKELTDAQGKLKTKEKELTDAQGKLKTKEKELTDAQGKLQTKEKELTDAQGKLKTKEKELTDTQGKLKTKEKELTDTQGKLKTKEQELTTTKENLNAFIQKWIDSMKVFRNDLMSIPQKLLEAHSGFYSGTNSIITGMMDEIINDRRSNIKKTIDQGIAITVNQNTTMDDIKSSVRAIILEDLGGKYPGWIDVLLRLYAYTKVSFMKDDLAAVGLNLDSIEVAAVRTLLLMDSVGIKAIIPELFDETYDSSIYDLEPIRTIDRIMPSVASHASSGIVADVYRIGYILEKGENKKPIVSIY